MITLLTIATLIIRINHKFKFKWFINLWTIVIIFLFSSSLFFSPINLPKLYYFIFIDQWSTPLIMLRRWISALIIIRRQKILNKMKKPRFFLSIIVTLNIVIILIFAQKRLIILYIFFEASLIPTLILILKWGYQPERLQAGIYIIIYTIVGALPFLVNIIFIYKRNGHLNIILPSSLFLFTTNITINLWWVFIILAFLIKTPIYGAHLWLPKAHVEAPVAGSIILAGLLLKLGGYGIIRVIILFSKMNLFTNIFLTRVALVGGTIRRFICMRQNDIKSLIAYSSVGHIRIILAGAFRGTIWGITISLIIILAHGVSSSGLFCIANILYEKTRRRSLFISKGLISILPNFSLCFFLIASINIAAPPSLNLLREIGLIITILFMSIAFIIPVARIRLMSAIYRLFLYTSTQHGKSSSFSSPFSSIIIINYFTIFLHWLPAQILILLSDLV